MNLIKIAVFVVLFSAISLFFYSWHRLRQQTRLHVATDAEYLKRFNLELQPHRFKSLDGTELAGWYAPVESSKATVILVHGYTQPMGGHSYMMSHVAYLNRNGYSVFLLDLRSFGESEGEHVTFGLTEWQDVAATYDYVRELEKKQGRGEKHKIGYLSISMGAATTLTAVGKTGKGDFLIAAVPFAQLDRMFIQQIERSQLPVPIFLPFLKAAAVAEFGPHYFEKTPLSVADTINIPTMIFGATNDTEVPFEDAQTLYEKISGPKELKIFESAHDIHRDKPAEFEEAVLHFLNEHTSSE